MSLAERPVERPAAVPGTRGAFVRRLLMASAAAAVLAGCQVSDLSTAKHLAPVPAPLERKISRMDMRVGSPILVRIYKEESELEVWKENRTGRYELLKTYEICAWSGELGPKFKEGDRQAPEGFYRVTPGQMNPNSSYHLAFNIGFPNAYDRSHGRTGSHLMVHGDCSSRGCYAMEDEQIEEIYALAREAFRGGQSAFHVHAFPFRMTAENMARHADNEHIEFWEMLKEGSDHFEVTRQVPKINVCDQRYVFNANADNPFSAREECPSYTVQPDIERLVAQKREADIATMQTVIAKVERSEERRKRWDEREAAVAAFFDAGRKPEAGDTLNPLDATAAAVGTTVIAETDGAPDTAEDDAPQGLRFGLFNRSADPEPAEAATTVAAAVPAPQSAPAPVPEATATEPVSEPAPETDEGGFFSNVAKGSKGLFDRATGLFN